MNNTSSSCVALIPAAGAGQRMGSTQPKQYLPLLGQPIIAHTIAALASVPELTRIYVVLSAADEWWQSYDWSSYGDRLCVLRCGGETRADSVSNGLAAIKNEVDEQSWVLVHDAARPCLLPVSVSEMIVTLRDDPVGGILAIPVADTLKRQTSDNSGDSFARIAETVPREQLWQAQTPQMFRHGVLSKALAECKTVTDEASAIEALGLSPALITGQATNLKITYPQDLALAELILQGRKTP